MMAAMVPPTTTTAPPAMPIFARVERPGLVVSTAAGPAPASGAVAAAVDGADAGTAPLDVGEAAGDGVGAAPFVDGSGGASSGTDSCGSSCCTLMCTFHHG